MSYPILTLVPITLPCAMCINQESGPTAMSTGPIGNKFSHVENSHLKHHYNHMLNTQA